MSLEPNGISDKIGNRYEKRWVVKLLLDLIDEKIQTLTVEAIGPDEVGVDVWVERDGQRIAYQCKSSNGTMDKWSIADLKSKGIVKKAQKHLNGLNTRFKLVSPLPCNEIKELIERAKLSNNNPLDFYEYQIKSGNNSTGKALTLKSYNAICEGLGCDHDTDEGKILAFNFLSNFDTYLFPDDDLCVESLHDKIRILFSDGNTNNIYSLLSELIIEKNLLRKKLSSNDVLSILEKEYKIFTRKSLLDNRILPRINKLNHEFKESFIRINNQYIDRQETKDCFDRIMSGQSIIIHGKAGMGKSGCIRGLINRLEENNILYLAIKLDKRIPKNSAYQYGVELDLCDSPVLALHYKAPSEKAVLILDQLDALRWSAQHSNTAMDVCKELIRDVAICNRDRENKISIIIACKSFDLMYEPGLKQIADNAEDEWFMQEIGLLKPADVEVVVGLDFNKLNPLLKELLRIPNHLYIWSKLDKGTQLKPISSINELYDKWYESIRTSCERNGISSEQLSGLIEHLIDQLEGSGGFYANKALFNKFSITLQNQLASLGLIVINEHTLSFAHQGIFDHFYVNKEFISVVSRQETMLDVLGSKEEQTPFRNYRILILLQRLADEEQDYFIDQVKLILQSEDVRFYYKIKTLEVLGNISIITDKAEQLILTLLDDTLWEPHIIETAIKRHAKLVEYLIDSDLLPQWLESENKQALAFEILQSVRDKLPEKITNCVQKMSHNDIEIDKKILGVLPWSIEDDCKTSFTLRMDILKKHKWINDSFYWEKIISRKPQWVIELLLYILQNSDQEHPLRLYDKMDKAFYEFAAQEREDVLKRLLPFISEETRDLTGKVYGGSWLTGNEHEKTYQRLCVDIVKEALRITAEQEAITTINLIEEIKTDASCIVNEIILHTLSCLGEDHSDYVIKYLCEDLNARIWDYTGEGDTDLSSVCKVITKHSKNCSKEAFQEIETKLYYFHEADELREAKYRFKHNKEHFKNPKDKYYGYWPYWGRVQKQLLPCLSGKRRSDKITELIGVLHRNHEITYNDRTSHGLMNVASPIDRRINFLKDKDWVSIITNPKILEGRIQGRFRYRDGCSIHSELSDFVSSFNNAARTEPLRFAKLMLSISDKLPNAYKQTAFELMGIMATNDNQVEELDIEICEKLFHTFSDYDNIDALKTLCRSIEKRAEENWSVKVIEFINALAKRDDNDSYPERDDKIETIRIDSINRFRGVVVNTISAILFAHTEHFEVFKETIEQLANDDELAVRCAAADCLLAVYDIDKEFAQKLFVNMLNKDYRVSVAYKGWGLIIRFYDDNKPLFDKVIAKLYNSNKDDYAKLGVTYTAAIWTYLDGLEGLLFSGCKRSLPKKKGIDDFLRYAFKYEEYRCKCKKLIVNLLSEDKPEFEFSYYYIFANDYIKLPDDMEFIEELYKRDRLRFNYDAFIDLIIRNSKDLLMCKAILLNFLNDISKDDFKSFTSAHLATHRLENAFNKAINMFLERGKEEPAVLSQCMDILDLCYEKQLYTIVSFDKVEQ